MEDTRLPVEVAITAIKQSIAQYVSSLCSSYEIPPVMAIQILQEIVYENRIAALSSALSQIQSENAPTEEIDISASDLADGLVGTEE